MNTDKTRLAVPVQVVEVLDEKWPGWVAAELIDAYGKTHTFHDKVPIFLFDYLDSDPSLPIQGWICCEIVERFTDGGVELVRIDTESPYGVESTENSYSFVVPADSVVDPDSQS